LVAPALSFVLKRDRPDFRVTVPFRREVVAYLIKDKEKLDAALWIVKER